VPNGETVTIYKGGTSIGTGTTSGGQATLTTSSLPTGIDSITASYPGDANYLSSTSSPLSQTVEYTTTTTIQSSLNPSSGGQSVTLTSTVTPAPPNDETVRFYSGATLVGTGWTVSGKATLTTTTLPAGTYNLTATYTGDAKYLTSTSGPLSQTVSLGITTTSLTASTNSSTYGQSVTLTATVSPTVPNDETVRFYSGATLVGTGRSRLRRPRRRPF
jgi:hypothetical protein